MEQNTDDLIQDLYNELDAQPQPAVSPALNRAVNPQSTLNDDDIINQQLESLGVDMSAIDTEIKAERDARRNELLESARREQDTLRLKMAAVDVVETGVQAVAGFQVGITDILRNVTNGAVKLADAAENYAAAKGLGQGDLLNDTMRFDKSFGEDELNETGQIARAVTNFAAPMLTAIASGGSVAVGMGVNAAYNFFAIDPKSTRISDQLKGTFVDEVPIASDLIDYLSTKPEDTEIDARLKNMFEGLGVDTLVGSMLWFASRSYSGIKRARDPKTLQDVAAEVKTGTETIEAAKRAKATPVTPAEAAAVDVSDAAIGTPRDGGSLPVNDPNPPLPPVGQARELPPQRPDSDLPLFQREWATYLDDTPGVRVDPGTGNVNVRIADDALVEHMGKIIQNPQLRIALQRTEPLTDAEMLKAANHIKNDSQVLNRLANPPEGTIPSVEDTLALRLIYSRAQDDVGEVAIRTMANPTDGALATFAKSLENFTKIGQIKQGIGSGQGRALRSHQVLAQLADMGDQEAIAAIGSQGRAAMTEGILAKYGGRDNIKNMANNLKLVKELADVAATPNSSFRVGRKFGADMDEIVRRSAFSPIDRVITTFALNGMLSSPATWGRAALSGAITTSATQYKNYLSVGIGAMRKAALGGPDPRTMAEANAALVASTKGLIEAIKPAADAIRTGKSPRNLVRAEIRAATRKAPSTVEDVAEKAGSTWVSQAGVALDKVSSSMAAQLPGRVLMGVDTYFQHVVSKGFIEGEAVGAALKAGVPKDQMNDYIQRFINKPPADVLIKADEIAGANTFAKELSGRALKIQNGIEGLTDWAPFSKVITPFVRTGLNIAEYAVEHSLFAPVTGRFREAMRAGGRDLDDAVAKVTAGTTSLAALTSLAYLGLVDGTDPVHSDLSPTSLALKNNRTVPTGPRLNIGDGKWLSLKGLDPLSGLVEAASLISKASGRVSEEEYLDMTTAFRIVVSETISPEEVVAGVSDLLNLMDPETDTTQYLAGVASRFIPYSAALRDTREFFDDKVRTTKVTKNPDELETFLDLLRARTQSIIPGLSSELPPERNFWGEALRIPDGVGPDAISPMASASDEDMPIKTAIESLQDYYELNKDTVIGIDPLTIAMPPRQVKNPMADIQFPLTPRDYSRYMVIFGGRNPDTGEPLEGGPLKDAITQILTAGGALGKRPSEITQKQYIALTGQISNIVSNYKQRADALLRTFPGVTDRMMDQANRKNQMDNRGTNGGQ